jgi:hypothetical protein
VPRRRGAGGDPEGDGMDWHELEKMKVTELREMAKEKTEITGVIGLRKDQLVEALAKAMGIEKPHKVAHGEEKSKIKVQIRAVKKARDEAMAAKDAETLRRTRVKIHRLKRQLRRMAEVTG